MSDSKSKNKDRTVRLSAVGDILLSGVAELIGNKAPDAPFTFVRSIFKESDLVFANLECPLSNRGNPLKNKCCLCSPPEVVKSLKSAGFSVLSLANNHIFDYGYEGFEDTVSLLKENDISYFGAGKNLEEARKPTVLHINGVCIGFLGYSWDYIGSMNAAASKFGTAPLSERFIIEDVRKLKQQVDIVVVSLHWGYERERYPLPSHRKLAHKIMSAGATVVVGHHPHVLQGIETYKDGIILYSLGNFVFPDILYKQYNLIQKPENKESAIFQCQLSSRGVDLVNTIPIRFNEHFQPTILDGSDKKSILNTIGNLSRGFNADYASFHKANRIRKKLPVSPGRFWSLSNFRYKLSYGLAWLYKQLRQRRQRLPSKRVREEGG